MRQPACSRRDADRRYKTHLQRALSCLSPVPVWHTRPSRVEDELLIRSNPEQVELRCPDGRRYWLRPEQRFHFAADVRFTSEWKVVTDGYAYTLAKDQELSSELLAWHWHPQSRSDTHLHVGRATSVAAERPGWHVLTGRVAFEQVVEFLVTDLGVTPAREDWQEVLDETLRRFREFRSWS